MGPFGWITTAIFSEKAKSGKSRFGEFFGLLASTDQTVQKSGGFWSFPYTLTCLGGMENFQKTKSFSEIWLWKPVKFAIIFWPAQIFFYLIFEKYKKNYFDWLKIILNIGSPNTIRKKNPDNFEKNKKPEISHFSK